MTEEILLAMPDDLPIIQKTYDLIKWYVPILHRLPRDYRFTLGDRMIIGLYGLLEDLIQARYTRDKLSQLQGINSKLDILRYQTRLLLDFDLIQAKRYEFANPTKPTNENPRKSLSNKISANFQNIFT